MKDMDWDVNAQGSECVHITIKENVDIENMELVLLNDVRVPIVKMKLNSREIDICTHTEKPMFAQIGHSVKYVNGSGDVYYNDIVKNN